MARVLIIDDDVTFATKLEEVLPAIGHKLVASLRDATQIDKYISKTDIVLLDVCLPNANGIDVGARLSSYPIGIVFMTMNEDEKLYESSKLIQNCNYLVKPFHKFTLDRAIQLLVKNLDLAHSEQAPTYIKSGRIRNLLNIEDILWIRVVGNFAYIKTKKEYHVMRKSLRAIKKSIDSHSLVQVHRNYVVNINFIDSVFLSDNFILLDNEKVPLSRRYKRELQEHLRKLI